METKPASSAPAPSPLKLKISELMKASMKSGDKLTLEAVRMLHSAVRKKEIDDRVDLDDSGIQKIVQSLVKQRQDSIEQFTTGGRQDLVEKETKELGILQGFLPTQMTETEVRALVTAAVAEVGGKTQKDMGNVMKVLMPKVAGKADGKLVNQIVKELLSG